MKLSNNSRGQTSWSGAGTAFIVSFVVLVFLVMITAAITQSLQTSTSASTTVTVPQYNVVPLVNGTISLGNINVNTGSFVLSNATNASNVIGANNYTVTSAGAFTLITSQYSGVTLNITYNFADQVHNSAFNASQQGMAGVTNFSSMLGLLGTLAIAGIVVSLVLVGFVFLKRS